MVLTSGATNVGEDDMIEEFEDNDESVFVVLESTDCLNMSENFGVEL